jgi:hypothetical protein
MRLMLVLASSCYSIGRTSWPIWTITLQLILLMHFKSYLLYIQYWTTDYRLLHDQNESQYIIAFQFCYDYWKLHLYMCTVARWANKSDLRIRDEILRSTSDRSILFLFQLYGRSRNEVENFILKEQCVRRPFAYSLVKILLVISRGIFL